jgi:hypothetical protein
MNNKIFDIKIYEDDLLSIEAIILDNIRNKKAQLLEGDLTEEGKIVIKKLIDNNKTLLEKLKICRLYNVDKEEKEIYKKD